MVVRHRFRIRCTDKSVPDIVRFLSNKSTRSPSSLGDDFHFQIGVEIRTCQFAISDCQGLKFGVCSRKGDLQNQDPE